VKLIRDLTMKSFLSILLLSILNLCNSQVNPNRFIVDIVQYSRPNFVDSSFRAYGTVISRRHVLTTANAVSVSQPFQIAVQLTTYDVKCDKFYSLFYSYKLKIIQFQQQQTRSESIFIPNTEQTKIMLSILLSLW
jgi:hypothetical protein